MHDRQLSCAKKKFHTTNFFMSKQFQSELFILKKNCVSIKACISDIMQTKHNNFKSIMYPKIIIIYVYTWIGKLKFVTYYKMNIYIYSTGKVELHA